MLYITDVKNLTDSLRNYFQNLDNMVINHIFKKLAEINAAKPTDISELIKLQNINGSVKTLKTEMAKMIDKARLEIYNIVDNVANDYYAETTEKHKKRFMPFEENHAILKIAEQSKQKIFQGFTKLFDTEGIGFTNTDGEYTNFEQAYRDIINGAITKRINQDKDIDEYIESAADNLTERGLTKLNIPQSGIIDDFYTRNISSGFDSEFNYQLTQMTFEIAELLAEEIEATGYEISYHSGHRPTHIHGGKQFTFEQMETLGVEDMLNDYNCRHWKFPVLVGITPPKYTPEQLAELEAAELVKHEWDDKYYTLYELTQLQNRFRRRIKTNLNKTAAYEALGDKEKTEKSKNLLDKILEPFTALSKFIENLMTHKPEYPSINPGVTNDTNALEKLQEELREFFGEMGGNLADFIKSYAVETGLSYLQTLERLTQILGYSGYLFDGRVSDLNYEHNSKKFFDDFIYNQKADGIGDIRMGNNTADYNGCGWVATYNICRMFGLDNQPADIIRDFETWGGTIFDGHLGVNPVGIKDYFNYKTELKANFYSDAINGKLDEKIKNSDAAILTYFHSSGAHYVAIQWNEEEQVFYIYNGSRTNEADKQVSIDEWLKEPQNQYIQFSLITVNQ